MMISTLLSFFAGNAFRMIWGELSAWVNKRQDHVYELERMKFDAEQDQLRHDRQVAMITLQHQQGVEVVRVQGEVDLAKLDTQIFSTGVSATMMVTGVWWVDAWNACVRPALATLIMVLITLHYYRMDWKLDEHGWELAGGILGIFIADRMLFKRGK